MKHVVEKANARVDVDGLCGGVLRCMMGVWRGLQRGVEGRVGWDDAGEGPAVEGEGESDDCFVCAPCGVGGAGGKVGSHAERSVRSGYGANLWADFY